MTSDGVRTTMLRRLGLLLLAALVLAGCQGEQTAAISTATLAPIVSLTPRFTATPIPSRTPTPTLTLTPSISPIPPTATNTFTPTTPPPIFGVISSLQNVNIRSGPAVDFDSIEALAPNVRVEVLGISPDSNWFNIRLEDGREGWIRSNLLYVEPTATPFPSSTPLPNLTALAVSTLPTALFGGGTITPSPPFGAVSATPAGGTAAAVVPTVPGAGLPIIVDPINATGTALAGGAGLVVPTTRPAGGPTGGPAVVATTPAPSEPAAVGERIDVFALCDNPSLGPAAPTNLATGSTVDVYFAWFAATRQQVEDHVAAATYEIRLDGTALNVGQPQFIRASAGGGYEAYWYLPAGPLTAGRHQITYRVTWSQQIFDGAMSFGPGTGITQETGSCTFNVR
jgi:hypothetical protein